VDISFEPDLIQMQLLRTIWKIIIGTARIRRGGSQLEAGISQLLRKFIQTKNYMQAVNRRNWLKQSSLAALGLGISLRSLAGEDYLPRNFGTEKGLINLGSNENPYGISAKAKEAIMGMIGEANRYQFNIASLQSFKKELGDHYGVGAKPGNHNSGIGGRSEFTGQAFQQRKCCNCYSYFRNTSQYSEEDWNASDRSAT
jgi:hypothetical protein